MNKVLLELPLTRELLLKNLRGQDSVQVTFTKADGTERTMTCSLHEKNIPVEYRPKTEDDGNKIFTRSIEAIRVFDMDKQAWRSFRIDSLKEVGILI